uniref:S1 motif domain-containing protein n=1 Tax=viral metagenome TaxID=1070528 RepID=A0A6C0J334_9ZZZZ
MEEQLKFYETNSPTLKSHVNFIFTERSANFFSCYLIDFNINAIMPVQMLTKRKKIRSINKLTPLNKPMIGIIEDISDTDISISTAYIDEEDEKYIAFKENNQKNIVLKGIFKRYSYKNTKKINELWESIIYPLFNELKSSECEDSLYDYFVSQYETLKIDSDLKDFIKENIIINIKKDFENNFKLVSIDGIETTKKLLEDSLKEYQKEVNCDINLDYTPKYTLLSVQEDNSVFFKILNNKITTQNLQVFVAN